MAGRKRISSKGSGQQVKIVEDTNSAVVEELVEQVNEARMQVRADRVGGGDGTYRQVIGSWSYDVWVSGGKIVNRQTNNFTNLATDIFLKAAQEGALDFEGGALTGARTLFAAEGFDAAGAFLPGQSSKLLKEFKSGVLGTAVSGNPAFLVKAGEVLYLELVLTEGGARYIDVMLDVAATDYLSMQPDNLQSSLKRVQRNFKRSKRLNK